MLAIKMLIYVYPYHSLLYARRARAKLYVQHVNTYDHRCMYSCSYM